MSDLSAIAEGGTWPIVMRPGRTFTRSFWLFEADGVLRVPLDGWDGKAQVRDVDDRLMVELTVDVSQETDLDDVTCGQVTISATAAQAAIGAPGLYDLVLVRGSGPTLETRDLIAKSDVLLGVAVTRL